MLKFGHDWYHRVKLCLNLGVIGIVGQSYAQIWVCSVSWGEAMLKFDRYWYRRAKLCSNLNVLDNAEII